MYVDEKIVLGNTLPEGLQRDFNILQNYYDAGDWFMFDTFLEEIEASAKAHYLAGKISMDDLNRIFRKYGIS